MSSAIYTIRILFISATCATTFSIYENQFVMTFIAICWTCAIFTIINTFTTSLFICFIIILFTIAFWFNSMCTIHVTLLTVSAIRAYIASCLTLFTVLILVKIETSLAWETIVCSHPTIKTMVFAICAYITIRIFTSLALPKINT